MDKQRARSALRNDRGFRDRLVAKDPAIEVAQVCVDVVCAIVGNDQYGRSPGARDEFGCLPCGDGRASAG